MAKRDYYDVLGVSRTAGVDEIKAAYRKLVRKCHPDVNKAADAAAKFREATEAYDVLGDAAKRKRYDQFGHAGPEVFGGAGRGGARGGRGGAYAGPVGEGATFDFGDIFGGGSGFDGMSMEDILEALGSRRGRGGGRGGPRRGQDVETHLTLEFMDAVRGTTARLRMAHEGGQAGAGETLDVRIPPGVKEGSRIRVRGKGGPGSGGGGDLYIVVHVDPHAYFRREGDDIHVTVPISITEAALGGRVEVPTIDGTMVMTIPPGTGSSRRLRLRGKGAPRQGGQRGDQHVFLEIVPPPKLTDRQRELLVQFDKERPFDPRAEAPWK
jgi:DnaJ-class molecular chaperone